MRLRTQLLWADLLPQRVTNTQQRRREDLTSRHRGDPGPFPSLHAWVEALAPVLPRELVTSANTDRMSAAVRRVPADLARVIGLEFRLDMAGADLLFTTDVRTGGRTRLAARTLSWQRPDSTAGDPAEDPIARFCRRWADPASPLHHGADDVWFEYDVADPPDAPAGPSFFFGPRLAHLGDGTDALKHTRALLDEGFGALLGAPPTAAVRSRLDACLGALPRHARIFQAGVMLARPERNLRLCIDNLTADEGTDFLRELLGAAASRAAARALECVGDTVRAVKLGVDLAPLPVGAFGLECYAVLPGAADDRSRWARLLNHLVTAGICLPAGRAALDVLPPLVSQSAAVGPWPAELSAVAALTGRESVLHIRLHHIKLACAVGRQPKAKAYVAVTPGWLW